MTQGKFTNTNCYQYKIEEANKLLQANKNIVPYFDGYKVEGYYGKHASVQEAENAIRFFNRIETDV